MRRGEPWRLEKPVPANTYRSSEPHVAKSNRPQGDMKKTTGFNSALRYGQSLIQATLGGCMMVSKSPYKEENCPSEVHHRWAHPRPGEADGMLGAALLWAILQRERNNRRSTEHHQVPSSVGGAWQWCNPWRVKPGSRLPCLWQST